MAGTKAFVQKPEHDRKLRTLAKEEFEAVKLMSTCLINGNVEEAKAAAVIAQQARARQEAYFNKLVGWHENGVPVAEYAR